MKKTKIIFLLVSLLIGCKEKDTTFYESTISLANKTEYDLKVQLFPKPQFLKYPTLYQMGTVGGGYSETIFTMDKRDSIRRTDLFFIDNLTTKPTALINYVFDSIKVFIQNPDSTILKFTNLNSIHYSINPYQNDTIWEKYEVLNQRRASSIVSTYFYVFTIDKQYLSK